MNISAYTGAYLLFGEESDRAMRDLSGEGQLIFPRKGLGTWGDLAGFDFPLVSHQAASLASMFCFSLTSNTSFSPSAIMELLLTTCLDLAAMLSVCDAS